jgi:hypothetical protein
MSDEFNALAAELAEMIESTSDETAFRVLGWGVHVVLSRYDPDTRAAALEHWLAILAAGLRGHDQA